MAPVVILYVKIEEDEWRTNPHQKTLMLKKQKGWCCLYHISLEIDGQIGNVENTKKIVQHEREKH